MKKPGISLFALGILWFAAMAGQRGGLMAAPPSDDAIQVIVELIGDKDKDVRALGLQQVREGAKGSAATKQFAAMLPKLPPNVQVELLGALAVRADKTARTAILDCLKTGESPVRTSAILALGPLGETADVPLLTQELSASDPAERGAAQKSLVQLCGPSVDAAIAAELKSAKADLRMALFDVLTLRRAVKSAADILPYVQDSDPGVRSAAMTALGQLAGPEHVANMAVGVFRAKPGAEREAAEKAVMFVCNRIGDPELRAGPLLGVWAKSSEADKTALLPALGRVGGGLARMVVETAMDDADGPRREAGVRALCNWPDASVAPKLIELVKTTKDANRRRLAQQALTRVAALPDKRSAAQRLALLKTAMTLATSDEERNFVLKRAKAVRTIESLRFVAPFMNKPAYAQEACTTVVELAHHRELREPNKAEFDKALDVVIRTSKDADIVDRAQRYKKGQTRMPPPPKADAPTASEK